MFGREWMMQPISFVEAWLARSILISVRGARRMPWSLVRWGAVKLASILVAFIAEAILLAWVLVVFIAEAISMLIKLSRCLLAVLPRAVSRLWVALRFHEATDAEGPEFQDLIYAQPDAAVVYRT